MCLSLCEPVTGFSCPSPAASPVSLHASCYCALQARFLLLRITSTLPAIAHCKHGSCDCALQARFVQLRITTIIIILIKRYSLTRAKLTALYKHLITKSTLTYISTNKSLNIVVYRYCLSDNIYLSMWRDTHT